MATDLCTLHDFVALTTYDVTTQNEDNVNASITVASRDVEAFTGRQFWPATEPTARYFDAHPDDPYSLRVHDFSTTTGLVVAVDEQQDGTWSKTLTSAQVQARPVGGWDVALGPVAYTQLAGIDYAFPTPRAGGRAGLVRVTATWGWTAVPDPVVRATALLALDMSKDATAKFGAVALSEDFLVRIRANPRVQMLLDPYRRFDL